MKTMKRELWEIRPLRWKKLQGVFSVITSVGSVRISESYRVREDRVYSSYTEIGDSGGLACYSTRHSTLAQAKVAAEKWYRTQLKKALKRATQ